MAFPKALHGPEACCLVGPVGQGVSVSFQGWPQQRGTTTWSRAGADDACIVAVVEVRGREWSGFRAVPALADLR